MVLQLDGTGNVERRYLRGPLVDQVLADEDTAVGKTYWLWEDHQGSIRAIGSGTTIPTFEHQNIRYDAFGNFTIDDRQDPWSRFTYTGQEYDAETGLYFYGARYYDPQTGRFLNEDPLGFAAGAANLFRYVGRLNLLTQEDNSGNAVARRTRTFTG